MLCLCHEFLHSLCPRAQSIYNKNEIFIATNGIANLISMFKLVEEGYCVTMDSDEENAINVGIFRGTFSEGNVN